MAQRKISVGNIDKVSGEVNIAAGDIIKNVKTIHQRALTAAEEAARGRKLESKLLAQGIATLVQNLSAQASEGTESDSPYKGLLPYGLNEAEIFYGRDKAKRDLLDHLKQNSLTVLHAESGAGKSSLLQAGIAAQLIANGHLAVYLRPRDADPVDFIKRMFVPELTQAPALAKASLREFLKQVGAVLGGKTTLYLLLDQFEEFFNLLDKNERQPFFESLAGCLSDPSLKVRWVLALRGEALNKLAEFEAVGVTPFKNMYSLHRLSRAEAQEAMTEPARRHGIVFEPVLIDHILDTLTTNGEVTPTHLQLVCSALTDDLPAGQTLTLRYYIDHEGDTEGILRDYLKRQLDHLPVEEQAPAWKVLRALITADRLRDLKTYDELVEELKLGGVSKEQIDLVLVRLVERRLLATQPSVTETFELAHDYLVKEIELDPQEQARKAAQELLIQETRSYQRHKTLLTAERLAVIEPYQDELSFSADAQALVSESRKAAQEERRVRERRRNLTFGTSVAVAVIMTLLAVWGFRSSGDATKQAATANAASTDAVAQQAAAQAASILAVERAEEAQKQKDIAIARQLAAQAQSIYTPSNQEIALLLSLRSMQLFPVIDAAQIIQTSTITHSIPPMSHDRSVTHVAFSPDGNYVVSGSDDGTARVWEVATGKEVARMTHEEDVTSVAFSPDGKYVVSGSLDDTARVWETTTGVKVANMIHDAGISSVAFNHDGRYVVSGSGDGTARVWETISGVEVARMTHDSWVYSADFSPDGKYVVSAGCKESDDNGGCITGTAQVWEALTGKKIASMGDGMDSAAFSPNGNYIVSAGGFDGRVCIWEAATGIEVFCEYEGGPVLSVAFSPNGQYIVSGSHASRASVRDFFTGYEVALMIHEEYGSGGDVNSVAFSPDGNYVISGSLDKSARVWEVDTGAEVARMTHDNEVTSVAFSPDGKYVVSGDYDGIVRVWEATTGTEVTRLNRSDRVIAFSPDGKYVVSGGYDNTARVWEVATGKEVARMTHDDEVTFVAYSPDGKYVVVGDRRTARVWEVATELEVTRMAHDDRIISMAFSPDDKYVFLTGCDEDNNETCMIGSARVWEVSSGIEVAHTIHNNGVSSAAFSPNGKYVVSAGCDESNDNGICTIGSARVWDAISGVEVARINHSNRVNSIAFSPDGKNVLSGSSDGTARVWDAISGVEVARMTHDDEVTSVAFSPDEKYVVSGSRDRTARVWEVTTGKEVARMTHKFIVTSVAFSPDGVYVGSVGCDETLDGTANDICMNSIARVWKAATGVEVANIAHRGTVEFVVFSTNRKYVISGSHDFSEYMYRMWIYRPEDLIANGCSRVSRNLTRSEWNQYIGDA